MIPAFAYMRCSGVGQVDGDTWDRQQFAIDHYAAANDYQIVGVYREEAISGTAELANRPELQRMLTDLNDGETKTIVIEKLDRLARDLIVSETIIKDLLASGYTLLSTCEPDLSSSDPSRRLVRQIFGAISEYDRAMIVLKLRGARQRKKAKTGKCEGRKAFGANPEEKETLQRIFDLAKLGKRSAEIADYLNNLGVPTRYGKKWHSGTIAKVLNRKSYAEIVDRLGLRRF